MNPKLYPYAELGITVFDKGRQSLALLLVIECYHRNRCEGNTIDSE